LARFLRNRPSHRELIERNIIPSKTDAERQRDRHMIGCRLNRSVSLPRFLLAFLTFYIAIPLLADLAYLFDMCDWLFEFSNGLGVRRMQR